MKKWVTNVRVWLNLNERICSSKKEQQFSSAIPLLINNFANILNKLVKPPWLQENGQFHVLYPYLQYSSTTTTTTTRQHNPLLHHSAQPSTRKNRNFNRQIQILKPSQPSPRLSLPPQSPWPPNPQLQASTFLLLSGSLKPLSCTV